MALYEATDMSSIPFKESKALILKKAGRLEESFLLHLELLKEKNIETVAESLFSGGWEDLPNSTYFLGEEVFIENINEENAFLQLLRLKKRKNNLEDYLIYLIEFDQKFDNPEVKRELYAGVWRGISTDGLNQLVSYYAKNIETIKTTREFAINAATYFKLLNRYDEAFSCLWSTKLKHNNFVDEGLLNGHWLGLSLDNLKLFKSYLDSCKFEGIDKKKAMLNIQLINISIDEDVDKVVDFIDELYEVEHMADEVYELLDLRHDNSKAIVEKIDTWIVSMDGKFLNESSMGKAISYYLAREKGLKLFLTNQFVPIDNNMAERRQRCPVMGRKNFLHFKIILYHIF